MDVVVRLTTSDIIYIVIIVLCVGLLFLNFAICAIIDFASWLAVKFLRSDKTKNKEMEFSMPKGEKE